MADPRILLPSRDDIAASFRNSWRVRFQRAAPSRTVDVGEGSFPWAVSQAIADTLLPFYFNHDQIARSFLVKQTFGDRLIRLAKERLPLNDDGSVKLPATGGSGYMQAAKIAVGGASIVAGTLLRHRRTNTRVQVALDGTYQNGDPIPIVAVDTGPDTNLDADEQLVFDSPPPGVLQTATILEQDDGTGTIVGLTGGRGEETDEELQDRIVEAQTNPAAAGNSAEIIQAVQRTPSVPVQKAFAIPAWFGPGTTCVAFTLRPDASSTRIPNSTQRGLVGAYLTDFPTDFNISIATVLAQSVDVRLGVSWITGASGFVDVAPWPEHVSADPVHVDGAVAISSTALRATTSITTTAPQIGQTCALFDLPSKTFKRKRIASVATVVAGKSWDLTFQTANAASDTYTPRDGALLSPWSPSLQRLPSALATYMQTLGPGEQFASFPDPGGRQRRWPFAPESWPSAIANADLVVAAKASGALGDVEVLAPATPYGTTVGTPGVTVYLLQLGDLAVYPQT